jgi:8-oxo-dGTP pyrophosphatase MutT (NUDIX family)
VAAILSPGPDGLELLLIRRAERAGDPWSGHMGLPGGRREPGDADLLETALRETREEIGVDLPRPALIGALDDLHPRSPTLPKVVIRPYVFALDRRPDARASAEVAQVCWVRLADLPKSAGRAAVKIMDSYVEVPCFQCAGLPDGLVVWGLTFRILSGLLPAA